MTQMSGQFSTLIISTETIYTFWNSVHLVLLSRPTVSVGQAELVERIPLQL